MASILAVDDSPSMRQLMLMILHKAEREVHSAEDEIDVLILCEGAEG